MNKRLKAEIWEIQIILYLILTQLIDTQWIKIVIWVWCFITFVGAIKLLAEAQLEDKQKGGEQNARG